MTDESTARHRGWKQTLKRWIGRGPLYSLLRPLLPGWPDEGRGIAQGAKVRRLLAQAVADAPHDLQALNAGGGQGLYSPALLELPQVGRLTEIDLSYATSRRRLEDPRQNLAAASLTHVPLATGSVDLILCSEVLEHIPDDATAFDELARVLSPRGRMVITVPTPPAPPDPAHVREGYTLAEMSEHLRSRGLRVVRAEFCMHYWFQIVLRKWRPGRMPRGVILGLAWLDRLLPVGKPMDLLVLARPQEPEAG